MSAATSSEQVNFILLLGAGFSRNWGGWLTNEVFEYLLGCTEIQSDRALREILWKHQEQGFEYALSAIQEAYQRDPSRNAQQLQAFQAAITRMFSDMNSAFFNQKFDFQMRRIGQTVVYFLSKFDAIFTLNQDLLLEHHYLVCNLSSGPYRNWARHELPGVQLAPDHNPGRHVWSQNRWLPKAANEFKLAAECQPLIKLHGSSKWTDGNGGSLLVVGGNKV